MRATHRRHPIRPGTIECVNASEDLVLGAERGNPSIALGSGKTYEVVFDVEWGSDDMTIGDLDFRTGAIQGDTRVELVTVNVSPYSLNVSSVSAPAGMQLTSLSTTSCSGTDRIKCLHLAKFSYGSNCQGDGIYSWKLDYSCCSGADCSTMDPAEKSETVRTQLDTESVCF